LFYEARPKTEVLGMPQYYPLFEFQPYGERMKVYSNLVLLIPKRQVKRIFGCIGTALALFLAGCNNSVSTAALNPQVFSVSGTVYASGGGAAGGATVYLEKKDANSGFTTRTGSGGAYRITDVTAGTYTITANLTGYAPVTSSAFTVDGDITDKNITLQQTIHTVTVTFDVNGGSALSGGQDTRTVNNGAAIGTLPVPARGGYTFDGWYTAASGGGQYTAATTVTGDITLYAHWTTGTYTTVTVTFNVNGGDALNGGQDTRTVNYGAAIGTLPVPTRGGYTFEGWYTAASGGGQYTAATVVTGNITLYAHWTTGTYLVNVIFDVNGGSALGGGQDIRTVNYGTAVGTLPVPTRGGYTFEGWYTAASGGGQYTAATTVTGNITLYAHWTINTYTVTFDVNGGSALGGGQDIRTVNYGTAVGTLPAPTRGGYAFDGWYTAASGGGQYTAATVVTGNITLYAHWTFVTGSAGITITFEQLADITIDIPAFTIYKTNHGNAAAYPASKTVTLTNAAVYTAIAWYVDNGATALSTTANLTVNAAGYSVSAHTLTVEVTKDGKPYSREIDFLVYQ
jgi:uncharacterized repeat protein (TIGR02543 family)